MNVKDVKSCSFSSWYDDLRKITIKSRIIPLQKEFIDYLLADGIVLPAGSYVEPKYDQNSEDENCSEEEVDWNEANTHETEAPSFPVIEKAIKRSIDELGGSVFPKLNWSAPKDAKWISANHTLQCGSVGEVLLLLKSSDFITHDLVEPFENCEVKEEEEPEDTRTVDYELILRRWVDINPGTEFRCFVRDNSLIAISQRDYTNFYEYIISRKSQICQDIVSFYKENIHGKFVGKDYVFDIYQPSKDSVVLIDFNPFGKTTDPLLFEWVDLHNMKIRHGKAPEFRCVKSYNGIQPSPYRYYAMPIDVLDVSTGQDPYKMIDLLQLMNSKGEQTPYSSSSEDEDLPTHSYE